jgi:hypothetical protein
MERITIEKTVSESGRVEILINEQEMSDLLSRELTGTTYEGNIGIFNVNDNDGDTFTFGDFTKYINLPYLDLKQPVEKIADVIAQRIKIVREWVKSCKESAGIYHIIFDNDGTYITMKG